MPHGPQRTSVAEEDGLGVRHHWVHFLAPELTTHCANTDLILRLPGLGFLTYKTGQNQPLYDAQSDVDGWTV